MKKVVATNMAPPKRTGIAALALDVPSLDVPLGPSARERGALQPAIGPGTMVIHLTQTGS